MGFYEQTIPYALIILWFVIAFVLGAVVTFTSIKYLDYRLGNDTRNQGDERVEFSFCLGCWFAAAVFSAYLMYRLWEALGSPFYHFHIVLVLLCAASLAATMWFVRLANQHGWWVEHHLRKTQKIA